MTALKWPFYYFVFWTNFYTLWHCCRPLLLACINCYLKSGCSAAINATFQRDTREAPDCAYGNVTLESTCHSAVSLWVTRPHSLCNFRWTPLPPHISHSHLPLCDTSPHTHASSRHWYLIDTSLFILTLSLLSADSALRVALHLWTPNCLDLGN